MFLVFIFVFALRSYVLVFLASSTMPLLAAQGSHLLGRFDFSETGNTVFRLLSLLLKMLLLLLFALFLPVF